MTVAIPRRQARFRPNADSTFLSRALQDAWRKHDAVTFPKAESAAIGAELAELLDRTPSEDVEVLKRYGFTRDVTDVDVVCRDPATKLWDCTASIPLGRAVTVPDKIGCARFTCGPRMSLEPNFGLKPVYLATLTPEQVEKHRLDLVKMEGNRVPDHMAPFFARFVIFQTNFRDEYKVARDWPKNRKNEMGAYPIWGEIEERFPVLGSHLAAMRAAS